MCHFVETWQDIVTNVFTLLDGIQKESLSTDYRDLVLRGTCFLVLEINEQTVFVPSRFIGYSENTLSRHQVEGRDGRDTNPVIAKICRKTWMPDEDMDALYQRYCISIGLEPRKRGTFGVRRKFIDMRSLPVKR